MFDYAAKKPDHGIRQKTAVKTHASKAHTDSRFCSVASHRNGNTLPVIQLQSIKDKLRSRSKKVVIAGETHGTYEEEEEKNVWKRNDISLYYEQESIADSKIDAAGQDLTPDPKDLRILFVTTALNDLVSQIPQTDGTYEQPRAVSMAYGTGDLWKLKYLVSTLYYDLRILWNNYASCYNFRVPDDRRILNHINALMTEAVFFLEELNSWIENTIRQPDTVWERNSPLITFNIEPLYDLMGQIIDAIKNILGDINSTTDEYRKLRSRNMLRTCETVAESRSNIIYKVGESHIDDMEHLSHIDTIDILHKNEYNDEYLKLQKRV